MEGNPTEIRTGNLPYANISVTSSGSCSVHASKKEVEFPLRII